MPLDTPTRVVFCEGNVDGTIGGSYFSLLFLLEGLDRSRFEPIVVFHREHALVDRFRRAAAEVHVLEARRPLQFSLLKSPFATRHPYLVAPLRLLQKAINLGKSMTTVMEEARFLMDQRPALLHLNNSVTRHQEWMVAASMTGTPMVVHERGINDEFSPLSRFFAPRLAAIICISEATRTNLIRHGVARDNLWVIPNGLDPARVVPTRTPEQVRADLGIAPSRRVIGVVGNIKRWKGQDVLVRALPAIARRVPEVLCLLVGTAAQADMYYARRIEDLIRELAVDRHVLFTGYTSNVADYLGAMEIAVHTSVTPEPFGRVLLEAMAMHKPVIGSRDGAVPEIVVDGETGFTFEPNNPDELAERVIRLLENPAEARAFGETGYRRVVDRFHIAHNTEQTMALYDRLLGHTPAARSRLEAPPLGGHSQATRPHA